MKPHNVSKSIAFAALIGLAAVGANRALAIQEIEPNSFPLSAQEIPLGSDGSPVIITGSTSTEGTTGGPDYFKITNTAGYTSINIHYAFSGSGPDTHRLRVLGPNTDPANVTPGDVLFNELTSTGINSHTATYTIESPAKGDYYYISCWINSADGSSQNYTITIDPSPNVDLLNQIAELEAQISMQQSTIAKFEGKQAKTKTNLKKQKKALKKAKKSAKKKIRKSIAKLEVKKVKYRLKLANLNSGLMNLQDDLAALQAQL